MKTLLLIFAFTLFYNTTSSGQEIEMKTTIFGYRFTQNGERLSWKELLPATESNPAAYLLVKKAKSQNTSSTIISFVGGLLTGIPIAQSINDRDPDWFLAYIGGGMGIIGITLSIKAFNNVNKGVDDYNLSLKSTSRYKFKPEFTIQAKGNGIGLIMQF